MDKVSKKRRSEIMSGIRGINTTPEKTVRKLIFSSGYRYRIHYKKLPGKPDLAFPGRKKVIFVNGCFWHGHKNCSKGSLPKSNLDYWQPKIERNEQRDKKNRKIIKAAGWQILTIWQCELKKLKTLEKRIVKFLNT